MTKRKLIFIYIQIDHERFPGTHVQLPNPESDAVEDTRTTSTTAYAAVDAKISARLAFVKTPTLTAKRTVNMAISPSCIFFLSKRYSETMAPSNKIAAMTILSPAATQLT